MSDDDQMWKPVTAIDYGQHMAPACQCPHFWWGVVPPTCPVHNPGTTYTITTFPSLPPTQDRIPASMSDADVERIARRVAELLRCAP